MIPTSPAGTGCVGVCAAGAADGPAARRLAADFGLPCLETPGELPFAIEVAAGLASTLIWQGRHRLSVDFLAGATRYRGATTGRRQPLLRACGRVVGQRLLDGTAGWGRDAYVLARRGARVVAAEAATPLFLLLRDAWCRAAADRQAATVMERLTFIHARTEVFLAWQAQGGPAAAVPGPQVGAVPLAPPFDVIYLDPMYPPKPRVSARPKLAMQVLQALVGAPGGAGALVEAAQAATAGRVVVKRPPWAEPLAGPPAQSYGSKLVRYDVYPGLQT